MKRRVYVYRAFERFWHWAQAVLVLFLALTGFEIHGSLAFFGFEQAVEYHSNAAWALIVLIVFAIFWHLTTGEWKHYIPTRAFITAQANYYLFGIFRGAPHPVKKTVLTKLNPLQRIVYFGLKIFLIPVILTTGLVYMLYRFPQSGGVEALNIQTLETVAVLHTIGAYLLLVFLIAHLYLITTGDSVFSNLKAMLTGWEELHIDQRDAPEAVPTSHHSLEGKS